VVNPVAASAGGVVVVFFFVVVVVMMEGVTLRGPTGLPRSNDSACSLPSLRTVAVKEQLKAFTTETPTPCSPPDTLYL
jgi:hypothetical protein